MFAGERIGRMGWNQRHPTVRGLEIGLRRGIPHPTYGFLRQTVLNPPRHCVFTPARVVFLWLNHQFQTSLSCSCLAAFPSSLSLKHLTQNQLFFNFRILVRCRCTMYGKLAGECLAVFSLMVVSSSIKLSSISAV